MTAPVVKVTEVVGYYGHDCDDGWQISSASPDPYVTLGLHDLVPEGVEGKRGRFVVTVSFEESE